MSSPRRRKRPRCGSEDILEINVGGRVFTTRRSTLTDREPDSMLAKVFALDSPHGEMTKTAAGRPFLDSDPDTFEIVLGYLRRSAVLVGSYDSSTLSRLKADAGYYALKGLEKAVDDLIQEGKDSQAAAEEASKATQLERKQQVERIASSLERTTDFAEQQSRGMALIMIELQDAGEWLRQMNDSFGGFATDAVAESLEKLSSTSEEIKDELEKLATSSNRMCELVSDGVAEPMGTLSSASEEIKGELEKLADSLDHVKESLCGFASDGVADSLQKVSGTTEKMNDAFESIKEALEEIKDAKVLASYV